MRYEQMFKRLDGHGAFIPFVTIGDPNLQLSERIIEALIEGGADALELGLPFSDPIADGPVIQAAGQRALASGVRIDECWALLGRVRQRHPNIPMGLLVYANLVFHRGVDDFYQRAAKAGVDSVLVADVPTEELPLFAQSARAVEVEPVVIATPSADVDRLQTIAESGGGYTYVVTRRGVTGANDELGLEMTQQIITKLNALNAPPPVLGFGISSPEHVRQAIQAGAAGAISGSAVVRHIPQYMAQPDVLCETLRAFVAQMKGATL